MGSEFKAAGVAATRTDDSGLVAGTGSNLRSRNLDLLRAAAALAVLFGHGYQLSGSFLSLSDRQPVHILINNGAAGVWLFFALSGYLIAGPFVRALLCGDDLPAIRGYAVRRVFRIYPAYFVALSVVFAFGLPKATHPTWWQYPLHFGLFHNLWPGEEQAIMFASWTLGLEALFYILVPLVAKAVRRLHPGAIDASRLTFAVVTVWVGSICWTLAADQVHDLKYGLWLRFVIPSMLSMFCPGILAGVAVAVWLRSGRPPALLNWIMTRRPAAVGVVVALVVVACIGSTSADLRVHDLSRQAYALASGIAVVLAVSIPEPRGALGSVMGWFGYISYGIYLWQAAIVGVIERHGVKGIVPLAHGGMRAYAVHVVFLLALVLPTAWLSWVLVEQPMIRFAKAKAARATPASVEGRNQSEAVCHDAPAASLDISGAAP